MRFQFFLSPETGVSQPHRQHDFDEVLVCMEGRSVLTAAGRTWPLRGGDLVCIPAGMPHEDAALAPRETGLLLFSQQTQLKLSGFHIIRDAARRFEDLFHMAQRSADGQEAEQAFAAALGEAMLRQLQCWGAVCPARPEDGRADATAAVLHIRALIQQRFSDPDFDLAAEISATGYSAGYFRRAFRAEVGRPPYEELRRMRLVYARAQLRLLSTRSVAEISLASGFRDPYHFSRLFKQFSGLTPSEYQRACIGETVP